MKKVLIYLLLGICLLSGSTYFENKMDFNHSNHEASSNGPSYIIEDDLPFEH
ncbi:hypothetical protein [Bacillus sp. NEB1478]|uniref:hypothetical protein n=1 Tax=Bacillus sp. NEB1478 TaxID=3073816 RepID=UPI00287381E8|nr:hypothetical protein [Bacillus sp. NEB1478]WNB92542.1 hypothetical protein RGB74_02425 [Bacillus sp. NEB1478]